MRASAGKGLLGDVWRKKQEQAERDELLARSNADAAREERRVNGEQLREFAALANRFGGSYAAGKKVAEQDEDVIELSD